MKIVKYLSFGKRLNKARGSHSLEWLGKLIGKSHSSVSEYEKGVVRPKKLVVAYLINHFKADPLEIAGFLFYDPGEIQGLCKKLKFSGQPANEFKEVCQNNLNYARKYRETDNPQDALIMFKAVANSLETRIEANIDTLQDIKDYEHMLLRTYGETIECKTVVLACHTVITEILPVYSKMIELSIDTENKCSKFYSFTPPAGSFKDVDCNTLLVNGEVYGDNAMAAAYFVAKDYENAIYYQKKAIPLCGFDKKMLAETYRGLILSLAHLNKTEKVNEVEIIINNLLGKEISDPVDINSLKCAIAEARMLVKRDGYWEILAEVESSIFDSNKFMPLKRIQFYKTQLFLAINDLRMHRKIDVDKVREVVRKGILLAQLYGYERHEKEIVSLGNVIEGKKRVESKINVKTHDYYLK
jgi:hypothetical protein